MVRKLTERKFDKILNIKTDGLRESWEQTGKYNRYEATPYYALEKLINNYQLPPSAHIVDFGSGKGRVSFFLHHHFDMPVTGIEINELTFEEAMTNKHQYERNNSHLIAPIQFECTLAEQYEIDVTANVFYFFNPFSLKTFKQVIYNILASIQVNKRPVDLILYYPLPEFKNFLDQKTPFLLSQSIKAYKKHGKYGEFLIYRLDGV